MNGENEIINHVEISIKEFAAAYKEGYEDLENDLRNPIY
jgi:hypothetical protein